MATCGCIFQSSLPKDKGTLIHNLSAAREIRTLALQGAINQSRSYSVAVLVFFFFSFSCPIFLYRKSLQNPCLGSLPDPRMEYGCHSSLVSLNLKQLKTVFHDLGVLKSSMCFIGCLSFRLCLLFPHHQTQSFTLDSSRIIQPIRQDLCIHADIKRKKKRNLFVTEYKR